MTDACHYLLVLMGVGECFLVTHSRPFPKVSATARFEKEEGSKMESLDMLRTNYIFNHTHEYSDDYSPFIFRDSEARDVALQGDLLRPTRQRQKTQ